MTPCKRTEITIETDHFLMVQRRRVTRVWCWQCGRQVEALSLEEAGALTGITQLSLRDSSLAGKWHVSEGADGALLICLESLLKSL